MTLQGRRLAKTEEKKRKGFCLLDARISTRTLFERERATALLSTATVDLAIKHPVLYVAVYKNNRPRRKNDEYRWAFLIGPSNETAGSEGVRCDVKLHLDSKGRPTWSYNQTIVPLRGEEDVLARLLIADVVNLGPLGKIIRDLDVIPTAERTDSLAGGSEWNSLAWVRERLDMLERNPDCFAYKCQDFSIFERMGRELAEGPNQPWRKGVKQLGVEVPTLIIVRVWKRPDDDETDIGVKLDLAHGETNTISRDIQFVTGVLGAASLERCRRDAEREQGEMKGEQKGEGHVGPKGSEDKDNLTEWTKLQHLNKAKKIAGDVGETEVTARPLGARVTTISFVLPDNHEMASEGEKVAGEDEEGEDETDSEDDEAEEEEEEDSGEEEDDDSDEDESEVEGLAGDNVGEEKANARPEGLRRSITVNFSLSKKPEKETEEKYVAKKMDEDEDEIESEEDEDKDGSESEGIAEENAGDRKVNARPESVRSPTVIFPLSKKPENAKGEGNVAEKDKEDENETESEEDEDEDESEESDGDDENVAEIAEKDEEDGDETESEEDEEEDESEECDGEDDDESDGDNENEEEEEDGKHAGVLTTVNKMPTTTLSGAGESEPDGEKGASS